MPTRTVARSLVLSLALALGSASAFAQAGRGHQKPATGQKPYEPQVGQDGKDVVWVPTPQALVDKMLDMAKVTPQDYVIDLGSGDGRTVITAAKRGARAARHRVQPRHGRAVEAQRRRGGRDRQGDVHEGRPLRDRPLARRTVITMFLLPSINMKLRPKILDLKPGTRIVSNTFTMEDWEADETADGQRGTARAGARRSSGSCRRRSRARGRRRRAS